MRFLLFYFLLLSNVCFTQVELVKLSKPYGSTYDYSQTEPSIAIDPKNPSIMAAGSILSNYYYSKDGGKTWKSSTLKSSYGVYGDPVLMFDDRGRIYYFHLSNYDKGEWLDRIVCQSANKVNGKFTDGSHTKPNGIKAQDKHWVAYDPENSIIYLTWTEFDEYESKKPEDSSRIVFARSLDRGASWTEPVRISYFNGDCLDNDLTVEGAVPAVGPNGELYITWTGPKGLVFQKSLDGGMTWMNREQVIAEHFGGWTINIPGIYRANGLPILHCDRSEGPNKGTLYLNWCDQKAGSDDTDVWLMKSTDGGETWSERIRVNQDGPGKHQFFTWMTVDQSSGYLYFVYYDRRNHPGIETDVYAAISRDGGSTFQELKLTDTPFKPNQSQFFGDYLNIAAVNGVVRPIFPRSDNLEISLWVALINETDFPK
ncbi:MAG: exo-alpha-sialidase [Crocinitomicaceae bacterium]